MKFSASVLFSMTVMFVLLAWQSYGSEHPAAPAADNHMAGMNAQQDKDVFMQNKEIDGYTVYFHVMKGGPEMQSQASHDFMVKVEEQGKALGDVVINSKVVFPSGKSESKFLNKMGDWYMNGYNLDEPGKYQLLVLFKTADGRKHQGGVYYERPQ